MRAPDVMVAVLAVAAVAFAAWRFAAGDPLGGSLGVAVAACALAGLAVPNGPVR